MEEGEDTKIYFQRVDSVLNEIREIGGTLNDEDIMEKILMTIPERYNDQISSIEEVYDLKNTREQLYGTLTTFEMRKFGKDKVKFETTFKVAEEDSLMKVWMRLMQIL